MKTRSLLPLLSLALLAPALFADEDEWDVSKMDFSKVPPAATQSGVTYAKDIRPLFEASCFRCHGEEKQKGDLRLDSLEATLKGGEDGKILVPGASGKSLLVASVARLNYKIAMPPQRNAGPKPPDAPASSAPAAPAAPKVNGPAIKGFTVNGPSKGSKAFTPEQIALVRAWIDQGAK